MRRYYQKVSGATEMKGQKYDTVEDADPLRMHEHLLKGVGPGSARKFVAKRERGNCSRRMVKGLTFPPLVRYFWTDEKTILALCKGA